MIHKSLFSAALLDQHSGQQPVRPCHRRVDQLALIEKKLGCFRVLLELQCSGLACQVDQVQELCRAKVLQISL